MVENRSFKLPTQLRTLREEKKLLQRELAQLTGLSDVTISRIEKSDNTARITSETLERLADALNVTTDTLLGRLPPSTSALRQALFLARGTRHAS